MKNTLIFLSLIFLFPLFSQQVDPFTALDTNKDGKLTANEFPAEIAEHFGILDANKDNAVSKEEFAMAVAVDPNQARIAGLEAENQALRAKIQAMDVENQALRLKIAVLSIKNYALQKKVSIPVAPVAPVASGETPTEPLQICIIPGIKPQTMEKVKKISVKAPTVGVQIQSSNYATDVLKAEEVARLDAYRNLATRIQGMWVEGYSKEVNGVGTVKTYGKIDPMYLVGVKPIKRDVDNTKKIITITVEITRAYLIESVKRANPAMDAEKFLELRYMFPEKLQTQGRGSWSEEGQKQILALCGAQLDARRKLVEELRGVLIQSSTRMEDFVVTQHEVVSSIETTLIIDAYVVNEKITDDGSIAEVTVEITRPIFIYSMAEGLQRRGMSMTGEEYQNLRNMLEQDKYQFVGKAAIK